MKPMAPKRDFMFAAILLSVAFVGRAGTLLSAEERPRPSESRNAPARPPKNTKLDVAIILDFSDLDLHSGDTKKDAALKNNCDTFAKITREQVYPLLREITGVSVGKYYKEIRIKIVPNGSLKTAGGITSRNQIKLDQQFSVDRKPHHYDSHELVHVFNGCTGVLRGSADHIWHAALMNAVQVRMGWGPVFSRDESVKNIPRLCEKIEASPDASKSFELRSALLSEELNLLYFDRGEEAIGRLYRRNMAPHPVAKPSKKMIAVWGKSANQLRDIEETLTRDYKFTIDERTRRACGF
jgi:hypothetical protein